MLDVNVSDQIPMCCHEQLDFNEPGFINTMFSSSNDEATWARRSHLHHWTSGGEKNMPALVASLALSQNGILNALCVIVTVARNDTEVQRLRLDRTRDAWFCAGTASLHAARDVVPYLQQPF